MNIKNVRIYTMDNSDTIIENGYVTIEGTSSQQWVRVHPQMKQKTISTAEE